MIYYIFIYTFGSSKSLVPWGVQGAEPLVVCKGDGYGLLCLISGEGWIGSSSDNHPKDAKSANLEVCSEEGASGFGSPGRGLMGDQSLSNISFWKIVSFRYFLGMPVEEEHEKEIATLLRKLETIKESRVSTAKRRPPSTSNIVRGLPKLECSVNYCKSNKKERSQYSGREMVCKWPCWLWFSG